MTPNVFVAQRARYTRESILSATPGALLTMLYDRLLLDLGRAESAQLREDWTVARENLFHAQDIVAELTSSLDLDAWDGAHGLYGLYGYVSRLLINANIERDAGKTREAITVLQPLRQAWFEASAPPEVGAAVSPAAPSGMLGIG